MSTKGYNIIEFSDKVGWDSSARDWARVLINTLEDSSIRILDHYETRDFCDFRVNQHGDIITYRVRPGGQVTIRMQESVCVLDEFKLYENLWESGDEPRYEYKHENGVYNVYKDGKHILSCEHRWEIDKEIAEYEEDQAAKQQVSKNKYRVSWSIIDRKDHRQDFSVDDILASNEAEARTLANIPDNPYVRNVTVTQV